MLPVGRLHANPWVWPGIGFVLHNRLVGRRRPPGPAGQIGFVLRICLLVPRPSGPVPPGIARKLASFCTIGFVLHNRVFPVARLAGNWVRFAHLTPANWLRFAHFVLRGHSRPEELASFCIICTAVLRPITDYRLPPTAFWLRFARLVQMKAWKSYSIGGIVALRCLEKPESKMSRLWAGRSRFGVAWAWGPQRKIPRWGALPAHESSAGCRCHHVPRAGCPCHFSYTLRGPEVPARLATVTTGPGGPSALGVWPPMRHSEEDASRRLYVTQKSKF